jgi:CheY-like chemotaxis protein
MSIDDEGQAMKAMKLLINEHDPMVRQWLGGRAEELGVSVTFARSNGELREALEEEPPDCVVLDACSSSDPALPMWRQLRQDPDTRHIPILLYSSSGHWQAVAEAVASDRQVDALLPRPFDTAALVDAAGRLARA